MGVLAIPLSYRDKYYILPRKKLCFASVLTSLILLLLGRLVVCKFPFTWCLYNTLKLPKMSVKETGYVFGYVEIAKMAQLVLAF